MCRIICIAAAILLVFVTTSSAQFKPCSKNADLTDVTLDGCEKGADKCTLKKGMKYTMNIKFKPHKDSDVAIVKASISSLGNEDTLLNEDACSKSGLKCPLQIDNDNQFSTELAIPDSAPTGGSEVTVRLQKSARGRPAILLCVNFLASVE